MSDILIKDGWIVDGTGNPWYRADIIIEAGRIAAIGSSLEVPTDLTISAAQRVVCPGFVDLHAHSDWWLLANPGHEPKIMQGITTELLGQDGFSLAPLDMERSVTLRQLIAGMHGDPDIPWTWHTFGEYLQVLQDARPSINAACLVGHGTIRFATMGIVNRDPTSDEMAQMKQLLHQSMQQGAAGMSSGLLYAPCCYAKTGEMIELCRVVADHGGLFVVHMRSEGDRLLESIDEMLQVSEQSGVALQISHFKVFGRDNWGKSAQALQRLERARERGIDVTFDQYPYAAGSTGLVVILPPWADEGGTQDILRRLASPADRQRIQHDIRTDSSWDNFFKTVGPDEMLITWVKSDKNHWVEGKTIAEAAAIRHADPLECALDLLLEERLEVSMVNFSISEDDLRRILVHPLQMVSTDAILLGKPHPRAFGTYPRVLGHYVREERLLPLEQAVRKMTSFPAGRLGLRDRGILREGAWADIVIFDPATIEDRATFQNPTQFPVGIDCVLVNGVPTTISGRLQPARAGRVLPINRAAASLNHLASQSEVHAE